MKKIVLTPEQVALIEYELKQPIGYEPIEDENEVRMLREILHMAIDLMEELKEFDSDDTLEWFYNKYKEQQAQEQR